MKAWPQQYMSPLRMAGVRVAGGQAEAAEQVRGRGVVARDGLPSPSWPCSLWPQHRLAGAALERAAVVAAGHHAAGGREVHARAVGRAAHHARGLSWVPKATSAPQHHTEPSASCAQLWLMPIATATASRSRYVVGAPHRVGRVARVQVAALAEAGVAPAVDLAGGVQVAAVVGARPTRARARRGRQLRRHHVTHRAGTTARRRCRWCKVAQAARRHRLDGAQAARAWAITETGGAVAEFAVDAVAPAVQRVAAVDGAGGLRPAAILSSGDGAGGGVTVSVAGWLKSRPAPL